MCIKCRVCEIQTFCLMAGTRRIFNGFLPQSWSCCYIYSISTGKKNYGTTFYNWMGSKGFFLALGEFANFMLRFSWTFQWGHSWWKARDKSIKAGIKINKLREVTSENKESYKEIQTWKIKQLFTDTRAGLVSFIYVLNLVRILKQGPWDCS